MTDDYLAGRGPAPDWQDWAFRLSAELASLANAAHTIGGQQS